MPALRSFLHSAFTRGDLSLDIYQEVDAGLRPSFMQVTSRQSGNYSRTRLNINSDTLTGRLKGNRAGVLEQSLKVPERVFLLPHTLAGQGLVEIDWSRPGRKQSVDGYLFPAADDGALGFLRSFSYEVQKPATVRTRAGTFHTRVLVRTLEGAAMRFWLHPDLPLPVKLEIAKGMQCRLETLVISK